MPEGEDLPYPPHTEDFQHEVELAAAIGRGGRDIPADRASDHVFGYAIGLDMTRRDRQREARARGLPWEIGKCFDHSAPCGPIHPSETVGHLTAGTITLSVNVFRDTLAKVAPDMKVIAESRLADNRNAALTTAEDWIQRSPDMNGV